MRSRSRRLGFLVSSGGRAVFRTWGPTCLARQLKPPFRDVARPLSVTPAPLASAEVPGWPAGNNSWRYVSVTHEAYVHPTKTMGGDLFIQYVGDVDPRGSATGMPAPVPGPFFIMHDADRTADDRTRSLRRDVRLLEGYLARDDARLDEWQYARALYYLAQSLKGLGFGDAAADTWLRFLAQEVSKRRTFSYLAQGAQQGLGQLCVAEPREAEEALPARCASHFEEAFKLCPRAEPLVMLASSLPRGDPQRLLALKRAQEVVPMEAQTGHCIVAAESWVYSAVPQLLAEEESFLAMSNSAPRMTT